MRFEAYDTEKYITSQERDEYEQKHSEELKVVNENLYPSDMRGWIHIDEWSDESMCRVQILLERYAYSEIVGTFILI